jgi:Fur family transcriptional regulator, peroxide stress response regulator
MKKIQQILKEKGVKPSFQRIRVLECLMKSKEHPTVEMIYLKLAKEIPTISKTTIYNTLGLFEDKGLVDDLTISGQEARYDYKEKPHSHFYCKKCRNIIDIESIRVPCHKDEICGNQIEEAHYYFRGVCKRCLNKKGGDVNG